MQERRILVPKLEFSYQGTVIWAITKYIENDIKKKHHLEKYDLVPDHSFLQELNTCSIANIPDKFYANVKEGSLALKRSTTFHFCKEGIQLDKIVVESDIVVLATGFKGDHKLKNVFASVMFQDYIMGSPNRSIPLYSNCQAVYTSKDTATSRNWISEGVSSMYVFEMRCRWLMDLLDGKFKVPSIENMEKDISKWDMFMKRYGGKYYRKSCIAGVQIWYNDQLCKDMGLNPRRKNGLWAEMFEPYGPMDYA